MKSSLDYCFLLMISIVCVVGCAKNPQADPVVGRGDTTVPPGPTVVPPVVNLPSGVLYINCGGMFRKINVVDSSLVWQGPNTNSFASTGSAMALDSLTFFTGSSAGIGAYNNKDASTQWLYRWQMSTSAPLQYREPLIKGNSIFFTSSTDRSSTAALLYCSNKNTKAQQWVRKIDSSRLSNYFNPTPVLVNDLAIVVTLDANGHRHLTAYRISDGTPQWSSDANDQLGNRVKAFNGWVYSFANTGVTCYDATTGSERWRENLQANVDGQRLVGVAGFLENEQFFMVELYDYRYEVHVINPTDGKLIKKASVPAPTVGRSASGCIYANNKLAVFSRYGTDSLNVRCYDLATQSVSWEKRFKHALGIYYDGMPTPVLAKNYILFPTMNSFSGGVFQANLYILNLEGKEIKKIPFESDVVPLQFGYEEKGAFYNQDRLIVLE